MFAKRLSRHGHWTNSASRRMETKNHHYNFFWQVPAIALVIPIVVIVMMATVRGALGTYASYIYTVMFFITPAVGVVVLLILLVLLLLQPARLKRINLAATITLAILNVIAPLGFIVLGAILSGFLR
jgi:hypothetical protein